MEYLWKIRGKLLQKQILYAIIEKMIFAFFGIECVKIKNTKKKNV